MRPVKRGTFRKAAVVLTAVVVLAGLGGVDIALAQESGGGGGSGDDGSGPVQVTAYDVLDDSFEPGDNMTIRFNVTTTTDVEWVSFDLLRHEPCHDDFHDVVRQFDPPAGNGTYDATYEWPLDTPPGNYTVTEVEASDSGGNETHISTEDPNSSLDPQTVAVGDPTADADCEGPNVTAYDVQGDVFEPGDNLTIEFDVEDDTDIQDVRFEVERDEPCHDDRHVVTRTFDPPAGNGTYRATYGLPDTTPAGNYTVREILTQDSLGNVRFVSFEDDGDGSTNLTAQNLTVTGPDPDCSPPEIHDVEVLDEYAAPGGNVTVHANVSDPAGIEAIHLEFEDAAGESHDEFEGGRWFHDPVPNGTYEVVVEVPRDVADGIYVTNRTFLRDGLGNDGSRSLAEFPVDERTVNVTSDPVAQIALQSGTPECIDGGRTITLDGTESFDPSGRPISWNWSAPGVELDDPTSPEPTGHFPLGTTNVTLTVTAGNDTDTDQETFEVVDTIPPATDARLDGRAGHDGWFRSPVNVTLDVDEACGVRSTVLSVDGSGFEETDGTRLEADGTHGLAFRSEDVAGHVEDVRFADVSIDATPPSVEIVHPRPGVHAGETASVRAGANVGPVEAEPFIVAGTTTVRAEADDATSGLDNVTFLVDGQVRRTDREAPFTFAWHAGGESPGEHTLAVEAQDVAGNVARDTVDVTTAPSPDSHGTVGPDPMVNGDFSLAVPGSHVIPGWSGHSAASPTETWVVAENVDGDMKVHTLGHGGFFGGPTNLGFAAERPTYSLHFDALRFEVTDTSGEAMGSTGLRVMLLAYWAGDGVRQTVDDPFGPETNETSVALVWEDVSTSEAAEGLTLADVDRVTDFRGHELGYDFGPGGDFTEAELANEWMMGGLKIALPDHPLHLDDFTVDEPVLFGTWR